MSSGSQIRRLADLLGECGWSPERKVPTESAVQAWLAKKVEYSVAALDFVAHFDGIQFKYPRHRRIGGYHTCILNAARAVRSINPITLHDYEVRVGDRLSPVGIAGSGHLVLMVSTAGKIYGGYDNFLALYGESAESAILNIYHRIAPRRVP